MLAKYIPQALAISNCGGANSMHMVKACPHCQPFYHC